MKTLRLFLGIIALTAVSLTHAQEFFSTEPAETTFGFGARLGMNASNQTFLKDAFPAWNVNSWGTGFDVGFVVDLNLRDYLTIQPGIFYESRSGNYAYAQNFFDDSGKISDFTQLGHIRSYNINIPVMASLRFNITSNLRWLVEAGPYLQMRFHNTASGKIQVIYPQASPSAPVVAKTAHTNFFDFGLKIGTGFSLYKRYSLFVHYMGGMKKVWKAPIPGGHNKAWVFTVGYDL